MTAAEILRQASAAGVTLAAREGQILARPSGSLTPELKRAIAAKKVALLELLAESTDEVPTSGNGSGFAHFLDRAVKVLGGEILDVDPARLDLDEPHSLEANRKRIDQIPEGKGVLERRGE